MEVVIVVCGADVTEICDCCSGGRYSGHLFGDMNLSYIVSMLASLSALIQCVFVSL